ncbi:UDP-glucose 4-epimerase GalE [Bradyrhizobium genosp. SA-3]|uniref:UDP-glucose 4-epimerase GalE n=1 Tax=Bradyrhizobium genosp. SA-3 TaxID=508868 RepID=UPI00102896BC|nr:UDP-glucose 4-epimerase GalE [Bradyrhizobium genosp. SA-3]RZN00382.1 UDP-glucose 4-epimerase GalE [Bradyrhizobium genosp. SA-3]
MAILITGGAGYIGSHMAYELADRGEQTIIIDDFSSGFEAAIPSGVPAFAGDIGDQRRIAPLIAKYGISEIIHFAASAVVAESIADPLRYYRNNTANTRSLIELAIRSGVQRFILSSTAAVYGNPPANPVTEETPVAPVSPYGSSKLMAETVLRDAARAHGLRYVILRYFNVAGADPALRTGQATRGATHLIKVAAEVAMGLREKMQVFGTDYSTPDGTCIRDYIHVSDLVNAHCRALSYLRSGGESLTLNCGYGRGYSVIQVIDAMRRESGNDFPVELAARRPGDPAEIVASAERMRNLLGWRPQWDDLSLIVRHAFAWERKRLAQDNARLPSRVSQPAPLRPIIGKVRRGKRLPRGSSTLVQEQVTRQR